MDVGVLHLSVLLISYQATERTVLLQWIPEKSKISISSEENVRNQCIHLSQHVTTVQRLRCHTFPKQASWLFSNEHGLRLYYLQDSAMRQISSIKRIAKKRQIHHRVHTKGCSGWSKWISENWGIQVDRYLNDSQQLVPFLANGQNIESRGRFPLATGHYKFIQIHNSAVLLKCASLCCYMLLYMEHLQICSSEICTEIFKFTSLCEKKILRMEVVPNLECKKIPHTPELPKTLHSLLTMAFQQAWEWQFKRNGNYPIVLSEDIFGRMFGAVAKIAASKKQRKLPWSTPQWLHDASSAHHGNIHVDFQE